MKMFLRSKHTTAYCYASYFCTVSTSAIKKQVKIQRGPRWGVSNSSLRTTSHDTEVGKSAICYSTFLFSTITGQLHCCLTKTIWNHHSVLVEQNKLTGFEEKEYRLLLSDLWNRSILLHFDKSSCKIVVLENLSLSMRHDYIHMGTPC